MYLKSCNSNVKLTVIWLALIAFIPNRNLYAQLNTTVFEEFAQIYNNSYLINPSIKDTTYSFKARLNVVDEVGILKYVNRFYLDIDKRISTNKKNSFHYLGLQVLNTKLGQYIQRSRMQVRYAWYTQISDKSALSAGISLGFINYAFLTTQGGTGGSDFGPDGMLGIQFVRPKTTIGVSVQQIFSSILIPVNQTFKLNRHYNIDFNHKFRVAYRNYINVYSIVQLSDYSKINYNNGVMAEITEHFLIGVNNYSLKKSTLSIGVQNIPLNASSFSIITSYSIYHSTIPIPNSTIELFVSLKI